MIQVQKEKNHLGCLKKKGIPIIFMLIRFLAEILPTTIFNVARVTNKKNFHGMRNVILDSFEAIEREPDF